MGKRHQIDCDVCGKTAGLIFNREHFIPPDGWTYLVDAHREMDEHFFMCPECNPKRRKPKGPREGGE